MSKSHSSNLTIGDKVFAKWPGSAKYYEATVTSMAERKSKHLCTVMFANSDGMKAEMKSSEVYVSICCISTCMSCENPWRQNLSVLITRDQFNIKNVKCCRCQFPFNTIITTSVQSDFTKTTRTIFHKEKTVFETRNKVWKTCYNLHLQRPEYFRQRSRSASPARGSPGRRRRSRSRSPARRQSRSRSPTRSSPGRKAKTTEDKKASKAKPEPPTPPATRSSPRRRVKPPAETKPVKVDPVVKVVETPTRVTRSVTRKLVEEKEALLSTETESRKHKPAKSYEFGGPVGATLMTLGLLILILAFYIYCNGTNKCTLAALKNRPRIPSVKEFFDLKCSLIYGIYLLFLTILYLLPVGKVNIYGWGWHINLPLFYFSFVHVFILLCLAWDSISRLRFVVNSLLFLIVYSQ